MPNHRDDRRGDGEHYRHDHGRSPRYDPARGPHPNVYTAGFGRDVDGASAVPGDVVLSTPSGVIMADPSRRRAFPSRGVVRSANRHRFGDVKRVLARAPWWDTESIRDRALTAHYENADGLLPDGLPSCIVDSWYFHRRCLVPEGDLLPLRGGMSARLNHIKEVYARFARMPCAEPIPACFGLDMYCNRTFREV